MGPRVRRGAVGAVVVLTLLGFCAIAVGNRASAGSASGVSAVAGDQLAGGVTFDGTNYFVVWSNGRENADLYGTRVTPRGVVLDPGGIPISTAPRGQAQGRVAFDGTNFLVAWTDTRSGREEIYAARATRAGRVLDPNGIRVSAAPTYIQEQSDVAFDGTNYLIVWWRDSERSDIYGARVSRAGAVLDPAGIVISTGIGMWPTLGFDGSNYLVAWTHRGSAGDDIYGTRVSPGGVVLDPGGIPITTSSDSQDWPALGFDGTNYLVAWAETRDFQHWGTDAFASRVSGDGTVVDPGELEVLWTTGDQRVGDVGFDGTNYLVAWSDHRFEASSDIYAGRVSRDGAALDPAGIPISTAPGDQASPMLAFDGTNHFVVWSDRRSGSDWDVYGARATRGGRVLDPDGILVALPPVRCRVPPVIGLRLAQARSRIQRAHCAVGRIRRQHSRRVGRVISQRPRPGAVRRRGYPVALVVGRR